MVLFIESKLLFQRVFCLSLDLEAVTWFHFIYFCDEVLFPRLIIIKLLFVRSINASTLENMEINMDMNIQNGLFRYFKRNTGKENLCFDVGD